MQSMFAPFNSMAIYPKFGHLNFSTHLMDNEMKHPMFHTFASHKSNFSQIDPHKERRCLITFTKPLDMIIESFA
jgi:hypothetical protein